MKKIPRVVIVGFPNVGKSTLFNRLLGKKRALVHNQPGMTRDRISAECVLNGKTFVLVDTGGIFETKDDPFSTLVREKAWEASKEADLLVFVLDGKRTLLPAEEELYRSLAKMNKTVFIVVNKIDSAVEEDQASECFRLGGDHVFLISAEHKRNLDKLEDGIADSLPEGRRLAGDKPLRIALVGRINVGKSSLINRMFGEDLLLVSELPGTPRDTTDTIIRRNGVSFSLVDTAGIRKLSRTRDNREKAGIIRAKKDIAAADVIGLVLDVQEFPTRQDTAIAHLALDSGKPLIILMNKWDLIEKETRTSDDFIRKLHEKMDFVAYAPVVFVSARTGQKVVKLLDLADEVYRSGRKKVATSRLNEFLERLQNQHPPVSKNGKRIKVKYVTQTGILPPTFTFFSHSRSGFAPSYEKFLIHKLRDRFDFKGTPIRIRLRRS